MSSRRWGIVNLTVFGAGWWVLGTTAFPDAWLWTAALGLPVVVALLAAAWRLRASPAGPEAGPDWRFGAIVAAEFVAVFVVAAAAGAAGRSSWIPALICLVVGVHFLPLARLFATPVYLATGIALVLLAAATLIAVPTFDLSDPTWRRLPGIGAALVLWATSVWLVAPHDPRRLGPIGATGSRQERAASRGYDVTRDAETAPEWSRRDRRAPDRCPDLSHAEEGR